MKPTPIGFAGIRAGQIMLFPTARVAVVAAPAGGRR